MSRILRPALFLDRDGVINVDHAYVHRTEDFEFIEGIFELVSEANKAGYLVIVVTNQSGIGRGYYTEAEFHRLTEWMCDQFILNNAKIDAVYHCPYHPEHGVGFYKTDSPNRKPGAGMIFQAAKDFTINLEESILLGDKVTDVLAGETAGIKKLFILGSEVTSAIAKAIPKPSDLIKELAHPACG